MTFEEVPLELGGAACDWQGDPDDTFQRSPLKSPSPTWSSRNNAWSNWQQTQKSSGWDTAEPHGWRQEKLNREDSEVICLDDVPEQRPTGLPQQSRSYRNQSLPGVPDCYSWAKVLIFLKYFSIIEI